MILINAILLLVHFLLCLYFISFYVHVYALYELFFIGNVVSLPSYVNMCACHVYFTITLGFYLLTYCFWSAGSMLISRCEQGM